MSKADPGLRVAFDHDIFVSQRYGGISRYFARLAECLPAEGVTPKVIAPVHINSYLPDIPSRLVWGRQVAHRRLTRRAAAVFDALAQGPLTAAFRPAIVHETYYAARRRAPRTARIALTVYDMIHELMPEQFSGDNTSARKAAAIARADHVFCISESTRRDLISIYPNVAGRTSVTLLGFDSTIMPSARVPALAGRPYLLYVGNRGGYKNFKALLDAYASSRPLRAGFDLLCVGGGRFSPDEVATLRGLGVEASVHQQTLDDGTLSARYRDATLLVYPSLYEGFGIPPLEAMAADCPVVTMNVSSIPEVCGDAADYAQPDDPGSLLAAIERVAGDPARAAALRAAGRARLREFSWQRCAAETAAIYREIA